MSLPSHSVSGAHDPVVIVYPLLHCWVAECPQKHCTAPVQYQGVVLRYEHHSGRCLDHALAVKCFNAYACTGSFCKLRRTDCHV